MHLTLKSPVLGTHCRDKPFQIRAGDFKKLFNLFGDIASIIDTLKPLVSPDAADINLPIFR